MKKPSERLVLKIQEKSFQGSIDRLERIKKEKGKLTKGQQEMMKDDLRRLKRVQSELRVLDILEGK